MDLSYLKVVSEFSDKRRRARG